MWMLNLRKRMMEKEAEGILEVCGGCRFKRDSLTKVNCRIGEVPGKIKRMNKLSCMWKREEV